MKETIEEAVNETVKVITDEKRSVMYKTVKVNQILWSVVIVFAVILVFIAGRSYQGTVVDNLMKQNQEYTYIFSQTERALNQVQQQGGWNEEALAFWKSLKYNIKPRTKNVIPVLPENKTNKK